MFKTQLLGICKIWVLTGSLWFLLKFSSSIIYTVMYHVSYQQSYSITHLQSTAPISSSISSSLHYIIIHATTRSLAQQHEVLITVEEGSKGGFGAHGKCLIDILFVV